MPRHPMQTRAEPIGQSGTQVGQALLKESRRLIGQSHDLLQAARIVLERCETRYPTRPVHLKRVA